ncbi:hypothetical protein EYC80_001240 [Monilinia laxa]|uniref:Uncharacterized protein n=1 Tax=Monilinia laxa TaxID=61186 RepID=A0A5N6K9J6_MONLA|nr:hypothetical protein EYC80_001240 [Monilinia laxa]
MELGDEDCIHNRILYSYEGPRGGNHDRHVDLVSFESFPKTGNIYLDSFLPQLKYDTTICGRQWWEPIRDGWYPRRATVQLSGKKFERTNPLNLDWKLRIFHDNDVELSGDESSTERTSDLVPKGLEGLGAAR